MKGAFIKYEQKENLRARLDELDYMIRIRMYEAIVLETYAQYINDGTMPADAIKNNKKVKDAVAVLGEYCSKTKDEEITELLRELSTAGLIENETAKNMN